MAITKETHEVLTDDLLEEISINRVPNKETLETLHNVENGIGIHEAASVEEMFKELRS